MNEQSANENPHVSFVSVELKRSSNFLSIRDSSVVKSPSSARPNSVSMDFIATFVSTDDRCGGLSMRDAGPGSFSKYIYMYIYILSISLHRYIVDIYILSHRRQQNKTHDF